MGEVIPRVACGSSDLSYALYLPTPFDPSRRYPILYVLDARAQGQAALERFRAGAEELGIIVASSNDSMSDGPLEPTLAAIRAMLADTHSRFPIDEKRRYATGFSGGARAAALMGSIVKGGLAGVIGCGAGFLAEKPPTKETGFAWFGTVGEGDFNYAEMRALDARLGELSVPHRLEVFRGGHEWPPAETLRRALLWMEVQARRRVSEGRADAPSALLADGLASSARLREAGDDVLAVESLESLRRDLDGLTDVAPLDEALKALQSDPTLRGRRKEQASRDEAERKTLGRLEGQLAAILESPSEWPLGRVLRELQIPDLRKKASAPERGPRLSATRILLALHVRTSFYLLPDFEKAGDTARAALCKAIGKETAATEGP